MKFWKKESKHVNDLTHVDCQGLAGHWTYATGQAGFDLVHRASLAAFGDEVIGSNRNLVPGPWEQDPGNSVEEWEPAQAAYLTGTPPCSGFSLLNNSKQKNARGPESAVNDCMKELIAYAGSKVTGADGKRGPEIVAFESVQGAFSQGRVLMQWLRNDLEKRTGQKYDLNHVLLAGATVGAAQMRRRYYFVASRVPFGIDMPEKRRVATYRDAIGDLVGLKDTWEQQPVVYDADQAWWLDEQNMIDGSTVTLGRGRKYAIDAHVTSDAPRVRLMLKYLEEHWQPGESLEDAMVRYYKTHRKKSPPGTEKWWLVEGEKLRGFAHPCRINPDKSGYVLTGGCIDNFVHWSEPRMLSVRECSRLMGLPDSWSWRMVDKPQRAGNFIGKCCPVQSGKWISEWAARALQGNPGETLQKIGDREYIHNNTNLYAKWLKEQQGA